MDNRTHEPVHKDGDGGNGRLQTVNLMKEFELFSDDVSNWYIRINRKRFWKGIDKTDQMNAYWCLYQAIKSAIGVMAPILPFITDYIWQNCVREIEKDAAISIHLTDYPKEIAMPSDAALLSQTEVARGIIATAQRMRNEAQIKVKQPLKTLYLVLNEKDKQDCLALVSIIKEELNIKNIVFANDENAFNDVYFTVNFRVAGAKLKGEAQKLKALVDGLDQKSYNAFDKMFADNSIKIGQFEDLESALFEKHFRPKQDFVVTKELNRTLALDIGLSEELLQEGFVRELIRQMQVMRKDAGFAVEQRIIVAISAEDESAKEAIALYSDKITQDVLANSIEEDIADAMAEKTFSIADMQIKVKMSLN